MGTTDTRISELDVVVLLNPVEGWPAGTDGTVQLDLGTHKMVEITGIEESDDDMLDYLPIIANEDLQPVSKHFPAGI